MRRYVAPRGQHDRFAPETIFVLRSDVNQTLYDSLTVRERECLRLARDFPTKEIARLTGLAPNTVDTYIRRATEKLNVNRRQAARLVADFEACTQGVVSQSLRLSEISETADEEIAERSLPPVRQPMEVREERVSFDFGTVSHLLPGVERVDQKERVGPAAPPVFWIIAVAVLTMFLIIGSVPMADSMGKIGRLIYSNH